MVYKSRFVTNKAGVYCAPVVSKVVEVIGLPEGLPYRLHADLNDFPYIGADKLLAFDGVYSEETKSCTRKGRLSDSEETVLII